MIVPLVVPQPTIAVSVALNKTKTWEPPLHAESLKAVRQTKLFALRTQQTYCEVYSVEQHEDLEEYCEHSAWTICSEQEFPKVTRASLVIRKRNPRNIFCVINPFMTQQTSDFWWQCKLYQVTYYPLPEVM